MYESEGVCVPNTHHSTARTQKLLRNMKQFFNIRTPTSNERIEIYCFCALLMYESEGVATKQDITNVYTK